MIITPLGHTEFLIDIANSEGENVRILVDSWLSDFAIGDLMERAVKVELDPEKIATIDAIYISHAHSDHLDPYTLVSIYGLSQAHKEGNFPLLMLPVTLGYLKPLFAQYLPNAPIHWLANDESHTLNGIKITGYMFPQSSITNEDDVMMLSVDNGRELLFAEIDTLPEEDSLDAQRELYRILSREGYETISYIASRNELPGQLPLLDLPMKKRKSFRDEYIAGRKEEMYFAYQKWEYEEFENFPNIFEIPNLVRGYIGQGIAYPRQCSLDYSHLQIFPLEEIASMESDIARECGYEFPQKALLPGRQYKIENASIEAGRKECPIGKIIDNKKQKGDGIQEMSSDSSFGTEGRIHLSNSLDPYPQGVYGLSQAHDDDTKRQKRLYASGPLFPREHSSESIEAAKIHILEILNHRFLPYWSASPIASLRDALLKNRDGAYRISFSVIPAEAGIQDSGGRDSGSFILRCKPTENGSPEGRKREIIFEYSFAFVGFREVAYSEGMRIDEDYWLDDILDFFDGRQELYSNFWHTLDPKKIYRLWTCLGANFMNHDLVLKKYGLHFERAIQGLTATSYVTAIFPHLS